MSLSFLSKKTWHTSNIKNVEQVWVAEQKKEKEAKKLKELQKQIDEERQIDELRSLQKEGGHLSDPKQKVEWMYEGPGSAIASAAAAQEYKLGKEYAPTAQAESMGALERKEAAGSTWLDTTATDENELFSRLNADPLYAMQKSLKRDREKQVLQNPLAMKRIKQSLAEELRAFEQERLMKKARKDAKKSKKKDKKKRKKDEKKKKDKRKRGASSESSASSSSSRGAAAAPAAPVAPAARPRPEGYGLRKGERGSGAPRDDAALGPSRHLVEARAREEAARRYRPEKVALTDAERAAKLAEFAADGAAHDEKRAERMRGRRGNEAKEAVADDARELARRARSGQGQDAAFLRDARAEAYVGGETTLADNVGRNRNRIEKRTRDR